MLMMNPVRWQLLAALVVACCVGCGSKQPKTYPVTGLVTYKNQPVAGAQVMFTSDTGRAADATTDAEGKFSLSSFGSGDGAQAGDYRVTISKMETAAATDPNNPYAPAKNLLPPRYANPSETPLKETVAEKANEFTFELTDS